MLTRMTASRLLTSVAAGADTNDSLPLPILTAYKSVRDPGKPPETSYQGVGSSLGPGFSDPLARLRPGRSEGEMSLHLSG
jgi:hypothetical protein